MSDLVRKSDVLSLLYGIFDKYRMSTDKTTSIGKSFGNEVFEEIRNIPTAYDIDKVVEELKELPKCSTWNHNSDNIDRNKAIEIVKQGSVSDDVCEWKCKGGFIKNPHTNRIFSNEKSMKNIYCNTCGKKIKVVE